MKALVYHRYGSPDELTVAEVDRPVLRRGEVLVEVRANSLNFADIAMLRGYPRLIRLAMGVRKPRRTVLGRDVAGEVVEVGEGVTDLAVGDRVCGETEQLGFAEYAAGPAAWFTRLPDGVEFTAAATLPVAGTTAVQSVRAGGVEKGKTVLVNGASGGVGSFVVRLAALAGGEVTGVCSTRNVDMVTALGARHVVDYKKADVTLLGVKYDVIIDLAGSQPLGGLRRILANDGVLVCSTGAGGPVLGPLPRLLTCLVTSPFVRQRLRVVAAKRNRDDLAHLLDLVAKGRLAPVVDKEYPQAEAAEALRRLETEHARGKIVLTA